MIDSYTFGAIIINHKKYTSDVIICLPKIFDDWWRNRGHEVCIEDLNKYIDEFNPDIVVVGTGKFGLLKVLAETKTYLKENNIRLIEERTSKAVKTLNMLQSENEHVMGALHLTC